MIQNEQELSIAKEQIETLRRDRDAIFERNEGTPFSMHLAANGFERMMARLQDEVDEYEFRTMVPASAQRS